MASDGFDALELLCVQLSVQSWTKLLQHTLDKHYVAHGDPVVPLLRCPRVDQVLSFPLGEAEAFLVTGEVTTNDIDVVLLQPSARLQQLMAPLDLWWQPHAVLRHSGRRLPPSENVVHKLLSAKGADCEWWPWDAAGAAACEVSGTLVAVSASGRVYTDAAALRAALAQERDPATSDDFSSDALPRAGERCEVYVWLDGEARVTGTVDAVLEESVPGRGRIISLSDGTVGVLTPPPNAPGCQRAVGRGALAGGGRADALSAASSAALGSSPDGSRSPLGVCGAAPGSLGGGADAPSAGDVTEGRFVEIACLGSSDTSVGVVAEVLGRDELSTTVLLSDGAVGTVTQVAVPMRDVGAASSLEGRLAVVTPLGRESDAAAVVVAAEGGGADGDVYATCRMCADSEECFAKVTALFRPLRCAAPRVGCGSGKADSLGGALQGLCLQSAAATAAALNPGAPEFSPPPSLAVDSALAPTEATDEALWDEDFGEEWEWEQRGSPSDPAWGRDWTDEEMSQLWLQLQAWKDNLTPRMADLQEKCFQAGVDFCDAQSLAAVAPLASAAAIVSAMLDTDDIARAADLLLAGAPEAPSLSDEPAPEVAADAADESFTQVSRKGKGKKKQKWTKVDPKLLQPHGAAPAPEKACLWGQNGAGVGTAATRPPVSAPPRFSNAPDAPAVLPAAPRQAPCRADLFDDDDVPDFLLSFLEEHVRAVEEPSAGAAGRPRESSWVKVGGKSSAPKRAPGSKAPSTISLHSTQFRRLMQQQLMRVAEKETTRHRLLTHCSASANRGAQFSRDMLLRTQQLSREQAAIRRDVLQAHRIAAQNTRLGNNVAMLDLHYFVREDALEVLTEVLAALRRRGECGCLDVVTGRGNHSRHFKAVLKPAVLERLRHLGCAFEVDERNEGCVRVMVQR